MGGYSEINGRGLDRLGRAKTEMGVRALKLSWVMIVMAGLAGCALVPGAPTAFPPLAGLEGISIIGTDKTITDHIVSYRTGKNCSTVRKNLGQTYCEEDEIGVMDEVYCYNSLGNVNCFAVPKPHGELMPTVGHIPAGAGPVR